jgi:hypothetical protein
MSNRDKKRVGTTVDIDDAEKVERWLEEDGLSMGWFMRKAFYLLKKKEGL